MRYIVVFLALLFLSGCGGLDPTIDSDLDGVPDTADRCPNTQPNNPFDANVDTDGCAYDEDRDTIPDDLDQCPATETGLLVGFSGCPLDSDGDGVYDSYDHCPDSTPDEAVDRTGCPVVVQRFSEEGDADKDTVVDARDLCPGTPPEAEVDRFGCPVDNSYLALLKDEDKDGVYDRQDECPGTPKNFQVDSRGCIQHYTFIVTFRFASHRLTEEAERSIREFAEFLEINRGYRVEIQGFTDALGSEQYNLGLSIKRAKRVYDELIGMGIRRSVLTYRGFGEAMPVAPNDTAENMEKNRRVRAKLFLPLSPR